MIKHNRNVHKRMGRNNPPCEHCGYKAPWRSDLLKHKRHLHGDMLYNCEFPDCDFKSVVKESIKTHMKRPKAHTQKSCQICEQYFPFSELKVHMESHKIKGMFSCDICGYQNTTKSGNKSSLIKMHKMWTHSGNYLFCNEDNCQYKTNRENSLKSHKENIHLKIKHTCDECGHQATTLSNLHQHKQSKHYLLSRPRINLWWLLHIFSQSFFTNKYTWFSWPALFYFTWFRIF